MGTSSFENSKIMQLARYFNNFYFKILENKTNIKTLIVKENSKMYTIGMVPVEVERELPTDYFEITENSIEFKVEGVLRRTKVFEEILENWRKSEKFLALKGWRGESFEVKAFGGYSQDSVNNPPLFMIERSATCLFGMRQFGVHINGYVRHPERGLCLWLQKRADNKQTWPGRLDNMVGGGLATSYSVLETAIKESQEEASVSLDYLQNLKPAGTVSFWFESERGLFPNTEFVFDLELSVDFIPENEDGEVQSFQLVAVEDVLSHCVSPTFKTTSCPVTLDFLVRHGVLNSDNEPHLPDLLPLLHVPLTLLYNNCFFKNSETTVKGSLD